MNRETKIIKNTIAYTVGNFGSKILAYVMVLVYTHYIAKDELGYYDLILTTVSLLQPIVLIMFDDGIYRWLVDDSVKDKKNVISTCIKTVSITTLASACLFLLLNTGFQFKYFIYIVLYFVSGMIYQLLLNAVRGLGNSRLYAESGIINSIVLLALEAVGLIVLKLGVDALLLSKFLANAISILYIYFRQSELHGVLEKKYDVKLAKDIFNYSAPLIPNNISWWIVNSSDRYIILFFLGASYNGVYSISNKFPTVVTTITGILYFSLQEAILKEYNSPDRDDFYGRIYKNYIRFLFPLVMCGIPATKLVIEMFTGAEYHEAWLYSGLLFISTVYSSLSGLLGIGYQISRETKRSVVSTVVAAFVNILINVFLVKHIGLHAASLSTLVSYVFLFAIRIIHSKKYYTLKINWLEFGLLNALSILVVVLTFVIDSWIGIGCLLVACMGVLLLANLKIIEGIVNKALMRK